VRTAFLVALGIFAAGVALSWVTLKINERVGLFLTALNGLFGNLATLFFMIWLSVRLAERGGGWIAAGAGLGVIGLLSPGMWAAARVRLISQLITEGWNED
jgi:hypothetical protein